MADLQGLIKALETSTFLSDEEKKMWYEQSQNMPQELIDILIQALSSNTQEEFDAVKSRIALRQKDLKEYADKLMTTGIQKIYKKAEALSESQDDSREDELMKELDQV